MNQTMLEKNAMQLHQYICYVMACILRKRNVLPPESWVAYYGCLMVIYEGQHELDDDATVGALRELHIVMHGYRIHSQLLALDVDVFPSAPEPLNLEVSSGGAGLTRVNFCDSDLDEWDFDGGLNNISA